MKPSDLVVTRRGARFMGRVFPCSVGRGGIVPARDKREGDGATPAGVIDARGGGGDWSKLFATFWGPNDPKSDLVQKNFCEETGKKGGA